VLALPREELQVLAVPEEELAAYCFDPFHPPIESTGNLQPVNQNVASFS
jgi:hypothetical protein